VESDDGDHTTVTITKPDGTVLDPTPRWQQHQRARDPYRAATLARLDQLQRELANSRN
jgi:hypothetical protein